MQAEVAGLERPARPSLDFRVVTCDASRFSEALPELLSRAGFEPGFYGLALVKPNVCGLYHPRLSIVERVLRFLEPRARRIVIGETNSMVNAPEAQFRRLGIYEMLKGFGEGVEALNLMEGDILDVEVPSPHALGRLPLPEAAVKCDLLVNIPRIGTHHDTMLTCALKNLFGLLAERRKYGVYHPLGVDRVIADVAKVVRCDLSIADAGSDIIVGVDPLAVDILACEYAELDPLEGGHLRLVARDRGLRLEDAVDRLQILKA